MDVERIKTNVKPNKVESLGNGIWYYNYDVKESVEPGPEGQDQTMYDFIQVRISGQPDYNKCAQAVIRAYLDANSEFDLMNSFNAYQLGIIDTASEDYQEYLQLLKQIKQKVGKDFNRQETTSKTRVPRQVDITKLMLMIINTMSLDDQQALEVKSLYPTWKSCIGKQLKVGEKIQYNGKLFKVRQAHTAQQDWKPGIDTASIYTEIVEDHAGTLEDPIPYSGNMTLEIGKYYTQDGKTYKCIRDTQIPVYDNLATLATVQGGSYVEEVA